MHVSNDDLLAMKRKMALITGRKKASKAAVTAGPPDISVAKLEEERQALQQPR